MARTLTAAVITELESASQRPILLVEVEFTSQTLRLWSGYGDLSWDSKNWLGNGWLRSIQGVEESSDNFATGARLTIAAEPASVKSLTLGESKRKHFGRIYLGFLDSAGAVIADPFLRYEGFTDTIDIVHGAEQTVATINLTSRFARLNKPSNYRYTDATQKALFPGDKFAEHVVNLQNWQGYWGLV